MEKTHKYEKDIVRIKCIRLTINQLYIMCFEFCTLDKTK